MAKAKVPTALTDTDYGEVEKYSPSGGGISLFYRPQLGENRREQKHEVRIVPASPQFHSQDLHYFGTYPNSEGGVCPGKGCPACDLYFTLLKRTSDLDRDDPIREAVRGIRPATKIYTPVYIPKEDRFAIWSMSWSGGGPRDQSVFSRLKTLLVENKAKKPLSAQSGRNLYFTVSPSGKSHRYAGFELSSRPSKLPKDWTSRVPDISDAMNQRGWSAEELHELLGRYVPKLVAMAAKSPTTKTRKGAKDEF